MAEPAGHARSIARRGPGFAEVAAAPPPARLAREEGNKDDPTRPFLERLDPLDLAREQGFQLGRQVDDEPLGVLDHPRVETERPGLEVEVPALEREHFALGAPAERMRDSRRDLAPRPW